LDEPKVYFFPEVFGLDFATEVLFFTGPLGLPEVDPPFFMLAIFLAVFSVFFSIFVKLASTFFAATAPALAMAVWVPWMVAPDVPGAVAFVGSPIEVTMADKVAPGLSPCRLF
jgi:uncharacterized MnhB-related membrane protein